MNMKIERIKLIARTFRYAEVFANRENNHHNWYWKSSIIKQINEPLARAYIERINYHWKFPR